MSTRNRPTNLLAEIWSDDLLSGGTSLRTCSGIVSYERCEAEESVSDDSARFSKHDCHIGGGATTHPPTHLDVIFKHCWVHFCSNRTLLEDCFSLCSVCSTGEMMAKSLRLTNSRKETGASWRLWAILLEQKAGSPETVDMSQNTTDTRFNHNTLASHRPGAPKTSRCKRSPPLHTTCGVFSRMDTHQRKNQVANRADRQVPQVNTHITSRALAGTFIKRQVRHASSS